MESSGASTFPVPGPSPLGAGARSRARRGLSESAAQLHVVRRRALLGLAGAGLLAVLLRLPFIWAGLGPDEGGYAFIAHQWANGAGLYHGVWVDRPQGLIVLYRAITDVAYHAWAIRAAAVLAGATLTVILGVIGWMLRGPVTGIVAAVICAVVGVGPHIEGFTMNSELAAAVPAAAAVACAIRWRMVERPRWLVAAGTLGAIALLMKQSGFDGLAMALVIPLLTAAPVRERVRRAGLVVGGAALPLGLALLHGLSVGWSHYWFAMYGWRAHEELGKGLGTRVDFFLGEMPRIGPDMLGLSLVALVGLVLCLRRWRVAWIVPLWFLIGFAALNVGGWYWPHYFVQVLPPLTLLAAVAVAAVAVRSRVLAAVLLCGAALPVGVYLAHLALTSHDGRLRHVTYMRGYEIDRRIAGFIEAHSTPKDTFYAIASRADLYFLAHRSPPIPYLWSHSPLARKSVKAALLAQMAAPGGPKFIVESRSAKSLDKSGTADRILREHYRFVYRPDVGGGKKPPAVLIARDASLSTSKPYTTQRPILAEPGTN